MIGSRLTTLLAVLLSCSVWAQNASNDLPEPKNLQEARSAVVIVRANGRAGTGFLWKKPNQIITAFHVVGGSERQTIVYQIAEKQVIGTATIRHVLSSQDLALLEVSNLDPAPAVRYAFGSISRPLSSGQRLVAVGFPLRILQSDPTFLTVRDPCAPLNEILPPPERDQFNRQRVLAANMPVLNLQGPLLHGLSGCPILDDQYCVAGIGHGGLEQGHIDRCWAVPAGEISRLLLSEEKPESFADMPTLLASEAEQFTKLLELDKNAQRLECNGRGEMIIGGSSRDEALFEIRAEADGWLQLTITNRNSRGSKGSSIGQGRLHGIDGLDIATWLGVDPGGSRELPLVPVSKDGLYFVRLAPRNKALAVPLRISCQQIPLGVELGALSTRETPREFQSGQTINDAVGFGNKREDWYRIRAPATGSLSIELENLCERRVCQGALGAMSIQLNGRTERTKIIEPARRAKSRDFTVSQGDELLVCVSPKGEHGAAAYRITWFFTPLCVN